jgi:hypothetical protein
MILNTPRLPVRPPARDPPQAMGSLGTFNVLPVARGIRRRRHAPCTVHAAFAAASNLKGPSRPDPGPRRAGHFRVNDTAATGSAHSPFKLSPG